jgi:hypothetical protein
MLPLAWLIGGDVRRSLASVILIRLTSLVFLSGAVASAYGSAWFDQHLVALWESAAGLLGPAMLTVTLWIHGWYVAYVTPDPPAATPAKLWGWPGKVLRWCLGWLTWPFRRRATPAAAATTRRKKKPDEAVTTPKRKRKTKRKPRTRTKVVEEEEAEDEEDAEEESEPEEEAVEDEVYEEEESEPEPEPPPARVTSSAKSHGWREPDQRLSQPEQRGNAVTPQSRSPVDEDDEDDDGDGEQWRVDGPSPEQLKGLSKRQRRALIKQHRDQQRQQQRR